MLTVRSLCIISLLSCVLATCREGFKLVGNKCYIISYNTMEWREAAVFCAQKQAQMLVVENEMERELLLKFFRAEDIEINCFLKGAWTAINCLKENRNFVVHPTNEKIPFDMWLVGYPNKMHQKCVPCCYSYKQLHYMDWDCDSTRYRAVCQYPAPPEEIEICVEVEQAAPYCNPLKHYASLNVKPLA